MPRRSLAVDIDAPCDTVFDLLHDYQRRLDWDSMLSEARVLGTATTADVGVRTLCVGTWRTAYLAIETEYIRFQRGRVAAVKLTNRPPLFDRFAATIRHQPLPGDRSRLTYIYSFRAQPRLFSGLLEPIINTILTHETKARLESLRLCFEAKASDAATTPNIER